MSTFELAGCVDRVAHNGLPLAAVGDFEKLNCQLSTIVDRSTDPS
jgi:hypothetical protein